MCVRLPTYIADQIGYRPSSKRGILELESIVKKDNDKTIIVALIFYPKNILPLVFNNCRFQVKEL